MIPVHKSSHFKMVLTREEAKVAFNHILDTVIGRVDGTPQKSALTEEGIDDIFQLVNLDPSTFDNLQYNNINN